MKCCLPSSPGWRPRPASLKPQKVVTPVDLPHGGIVMYCTPWCPDCRKARQWLQECGLEFQEVDVTRNRQAADQVRSWTGGSLVTPTFDIDGTIVIDYDRTRLAELLKI